MSFSSRVVDITPTATAAAVAVLPESSGATGLLALIERLVTTPGANVENLERLIAMQERLNLSSAEQVFNGAMSAAQQDMRPIAADAYNPSTKSRYASYAALDRALRPVYTRHGFALSFNTVETSREAEVRIVCLVTCGGFVRTYHIDMPSDGKGAKGGDVMTRTHATGSAVSYGMRYLLKMIFNVAIGADGEDDDGQGAGRTASTAAESASGSASPAGFDAWLEELRSAAVAGAFASAFNTATLPLRTHLTKHFTAEFQRLKQVSADALKAGR